MGSPVTIHLPPSNPLSSTPSPKSDCSGKTSTQTAYIAQLWCPWRRRGGSPLYGNFNELQKTVGSRTV